MPPTAARLTDAGFSEAGGAFLSNRVGIQNFSTNFTFQIKPGTSPMADGMAFVIQGDGNKALGPGGGGLGYGSDTLGAGGGLPRSIAIKFDIYNNAGEGVNSTGIFTGGRSPTVRQPGLSAGFPDTSVTLAGTGIDLSSTHPFTVTLGYDGTTLNETITDTVTSATFTTSYDVNIPGIVGSDVGYVGFTGGTGGLSAIEDITSWTIQTTIQKHDSTSQSGSGGPATGAQVLALSAASPTTTTSGPTQTAPAALLTAPAGGSGDARSIGPTNLDDDWLSDVIVVDTDATAAQDAVFAELGDVEDLLDPLR